VLTSKYYTIIDKHGLHSLNVPSASAGSQTQRWLCHMMTIISLPEIRQTTQHYTYLPETTTNELDQLL